MISVITYGRNDNYGYNLYKRTACGFNCLAELLTETDEIIFVDYNTPGHLPTLPEYIWDTLTERALNVLKVVRISSDIHRQIKNGSPLPILENVSRNAAIIRSNPENQWILSTNPDVILILSSRWESLRQLLEQRPASFYEMPRFDIPESVWSSLSRLEPSQNIQALRAWLISNGAAIAETVPDHRFQKFFLFDAPGDFQLAPRDYFFRLRGFDESMNKYLHSDSNLAKRMWLLNGRKTDHLLGDLWVAHQDHYLSGEWATNSRTIAHNDYIAKVLHQQEIEANDDNWGLQKIALPMFRLVEKCARPKVHSASLPESNGDLPLSQEIDWETHPFHRLCHYEPAVLALYLREILRVMSPEFQIAYLGDHQPTLQQVRNAWAQMHPDSRPVLHLAETSSSVAPDVLLVDFYHDRSERVANRIRLLKEKFQRQLKQGGLTAEKLDEQLSVAADLLDSQEQKERLLPVWKKLFPLVKIHPGTHVILMGCNTGVGIFHKFQEFFAAACDLPQPSRSRGRLRRLYGSIKLRRENKRTLPYFHHRMPESQKLLKPLKLRYLYMHHRLIVMIADPQQQSG